MRGDLAGIVLGLGILAPRDMTWLWNEIRLICASSGTAVPGGDSACGFANTAMQLAGQKMLPEVLAAVVRSMSAVRALAAFEQGAVGPSKDCAYEGPIMKAITGYPISMEGKSASCAHFSPIGNIASSMCDLWSNESVQNVRLLSGNAPEVFTELLEYDCRLMNMATAKGSALTLRNLMVSSDEWLSPQAAVLSPEATMEIAGAIVDADNPYASTLAAGRVAVNILRRGYEKGILTVNKKDQIWLDRIEKELSQLPSTAEELVVQTKAQYETIYDRTSYGL
jgi:methanol--5-hydroxybenzimidazolylcobamide Co-methyltransferase